MSEAGAGLEEIERALAGVGLVSRGAFHPEPGDNVPVLASGAPARTLVLAGNEGPSMWQAFSKAERASEHALDAWSREILEPIAARFAGAAIFPGGGPPYLPFIAWAQRAGPVSSSALGLLIHPDFGLWHAYRGALALPRRLDLPAPDTRANPCDACADKPCLTACPVGAFKPSGYDVPACIAYLESPPGADCASHGCAARRACPVGQEHVYAPAQAAFHMEAFVKANKR
ncbi:MAG: hypothetical protein ACTSUD_03540 [Alphaproteobacteria bacterium]